MRKLDNSAESALTNIRHYQLRAICKYFYKNVKKILQFSKIILILHKSSA